jgi:hypothetical protein
MPRDDYLFSRINWFSVEEHQMTQLKNEVANYDGNRLLNTAVDDLSRYFADKYRIDVPILQRNSIVAGQREAQVDVSDRLEYLSRYGGPNYVLGTTVEITIPFTGDHQIFEIQPTRRNLNLPRARVHNNTLVLDITGIDMGADRVRSEIDTMIDSIESCLTNLRSNADSFNASLTGIARTAIDARRQKLLANQNLVSSLGFALKESPNSPQTYTAPNVRRKLSPTPPPASSAPYRPEPSLSDPDYNHILTVIQNMTYVMERSPAAFASMDEEALRTHFLVQLNGHYEGQATGETFNYEGKTDILIRADGKNIFIAECKFWGGPKKLIETLDQLLGYSSWRDTKVAVLVFNRNKDFSKVLESVQSTVVAHSNCKRFVGAQSETSFRYVFSHRDDANREMTLSVLAFDIPSA